MAESWLCRLDGVRGFTKRVVVKTLRPGHQNDEFHTMFADEAHIGACLDHPNIVKVLEFGNGPTGPFIAQEFVEGPNVAQIMTRQAQKDAPDLRLGVRLVSSIASALDHAFHVPDEQGRPRHVIHRDVSPSNILVSRLGVPKLIDFGVASFEGREARTQVGVLKGKLRYMAPEALLQGVVSHQGDVYSLGIVLYTLCSGESPWKTSEGDSPGLIRLPLRVKPHVDLELAAIMERCLQPDRKLRFATAKELQVALDQWLAHNGGPVEDAEVAARLQELFPEGSAGWKGDMDSSVLSSASLQVRPAPSEASRESAAAPARAPAAAPPWGWFAVLALALFVPSAGAFFAAMAAVWLALSAPAPEAPSLEVTQAPSTQATPAELQAREAEAARAAALVVLERVKVLEQLAELEPEAALVQAKKLAEEHQTPEFLAWVEALQRRVDGAKAPAPTPPAPKPAPAKPAKPAPAKPAPAKPAPADDVLDTRIRRPPSQPVPDGSQ
jgi:hypothetical protein